MQPYQSKYKILQALGKNNALCVQFPKLQLNVLQATVSYPSEFES